MFLSFVLGLRRMTGLGSRCFMDGFGDSFGSGGLAGGFGGVMSGVFTASGTSMSLTSVGRAGGEGLSGFGGLSGGVGLEEAEVLERLIRGRGLGGRLNVETCVSFGDELGDTDGLWATISGVGWSMLRCDP